MEYRLSISFVSDASISQWLWCSLYLCLTIERKCAITKKRKEEIRTKNKMIKVCFRYKQDRKKWRWTIQNRVYFDTQIQPRWKCSHCVCISNVLKRLEEVEKKYDSTTRGYPSLQVYCFNGRLVFRLAYSVSFCTSTTCFLCWESLQIELQCCCFRLFFWKSFTCELVYNLNYPW